MKSRLGCALVLTFAFTLGAACSDSTPAGDDTRGSSNKDGGAAVAPSGAASATASAAVAPAPLADAGEDAAPATTPAPPPPAPLKAVGEPCTIVTAQGSTECASGVCQTQPETLSGWSSYHAGTFCTIACTTHEECASPPFARVCGTWIYFNGVGGPDLFCRVHEFTP